MRNFATIMLLLISTFATALHAQDGKSWSFAVSGDSRNCGDVVMPAIAEHARQDGISFYWHLGDFRAIYDFDQDYKQLHPKVSIRDYEQTAWQDFIDHQLAPFGSTPIFLAFGNHEMFPPKGRTEALLQFADWFDSPEIRAQRLKDDPRDHALRGYYHWVKDGVDFISLDNATPDQFDEGQLKWLGDVMTLDSKDPAIRSLVVGMHAALPDSIGTGHSMNESAQGTKSGREVYNQLVKFRRDTHKNVYVLSSHSHFFIAEVYNTACRQQHPETVLPGWTVGTAGAVRYRLPADISGASAAKTDVYGYLLGTVAPDGSIQFQFHPIEEKDIPAETNKLFSPEFVHSCFVGNQTQYVPAGPPTPPNCP